MAEGGTNPYKAGNFFEGSEFITDQFVQVFTDLFLDERLTVFIRISAKSNATCLAMRHSYVDHTTVSLHQSYAFYRVFGSTLTSSHNIPSVISRPFSIIGSSPAPSVLVMTDNLGGLKYLYVNQANKTTTQQLVADGTKPTIFYPRDDQYQFFGEYIEFVAQDGQSIYRLTVDGGNNISVTLDRTEPQRLQDLYISHGHNRPYLNDHLYIGHLLSLGDLSSRLERTETSFGGVATPSTAIIKVALSDEYFDYIVNQPWDTRSVEILAGLSSDPISQYRVILRGNTDYAEWDEDILSITLKDHSIFFDREIQENTYKGTGGFEGTEEIKGNVKPLCYGHVEHAEPILVNPNLNLYQFHDGPSHPNIEIREGGVNRPNLIVSSALLAWAPTPTEVSSAAIRINYNTGFFRLSSPPEMPITFTKHGDTSVPITATLADISRALIMRSAPELDIDNDNFDSHKSKLAQPYGLYLRDQTTLFEAFRMLAAPTGDFILLSRINRVKIKSLRRETARAFIDDRSIAQGTSINRREPPKPGKIYKLGYKKTWALLDESQLLGAADQVIRHLMASEYRWNEYIIEFQNQPNPKRFDSAKVVEIESNLLNAHNDLIVEIGLRDLAYRDLYEITVIGFSFMFEVGDTILLQLARWNMRVPRTMIIIELTEMSPTIGTEDQTKLLLLG